MPKIQQSYIGKKFGKLTILSEPFCLYKGKQLRKFIRILCKCGVEKDSNFYRVTNGEVLSCGCGSIEKLKSLATHGLYKHTLYQTWKNIKVRCDYPSSKAYKDYGGRGITMCDEWRNSFKAFFDWAIANGWAKGLTIDRENNNGNYEPSNCRFLTKRENCRNKRCNKLTAQRAYHIRLLFSAGKTRNQLANLYGVAHNTVCRVIYNKIWA